MQDKIAKLKAIKILFVEDEEDLITIISDTLTKLQANFVTAYNGKEALEILEADKSIDLVITDINMPVMSGLELIKEVRKVNSTLPFIIMSAHTEPEYIQSAEALGVTDYLLKPIDFIKFINLVSQLDLK